MPFALVDRQHPASGNRTFVIYRVALAHVSDVAGPEKTEKLKCEANRVRGGGPAAAPLYMFRRAGAGRQGQICRMTARGSMNSCRLEFNDGFELITSRNALRRVRA
jgi:hypothetical protein